MVLTRTFRPSLIIHIFALLHAAVALFCRLGGVEDELLLTILTMAMTLIICYQKNLSIEFTASMIIIGNVVGYLMGTLGANLLSSILSSELLVHSLSTAFTTEVLGWSIVAITRIFRQGTGHRNGTIALPPYMKWILLAAAGVFAIRLFIVFFFSGDAFKDGKVLSMTANILSNSVGIITLICINILYVRYANGIRSRSNAWQSTLIFIGIMLGATLVEAFIVGFGLPFDPKTEFNGDIFLLLMVSFITQITAYCIVYMVNYALTARSEMHEQREKANMAQYRYLKLKRQVNPHFLFNSLNILDCLVCDEKTEQASIYIHKLAGIYRYMIKSEEETLVPLRDELVFVNLYVDLLKVRFPEGFEVNIDVSKDLLGMYVLPCSIQLLIENATKHNTVSPDNPLIINVKSSGNIVRVSNNIIPKVTVSPSTGLGHKYIRQQYRDLSGKEIAIHRSDDTYYVDLPLL